MDILTLDGVAFTGYSTPDVMMGGGRQAMVVHKLPGGSRVIDMLGPDEHQIAWRGHLFDSNAYNMALTLDAMRAAGGVRSLQWGGQARLVIIDDFVYRVRRLPVWVDYAIVCTVVVNPSLGALGGAIGGGIGALITADLQFALG